METVVTIIVYYGLSIVFAVFVIVFLRKRRIRQQNNYPSDWKRFKKAIEQNKISEIAKFGSNVIWNENLDPEHTRIIYNEVKKRKNQYPELDKLWIDVHYKTHGLEPIVEK